MVLMSFNCRTNAFPPQGRSENVRCPFVVHSQTWPLGSTGDAPAGVGCDGAGISGPLSGDGSGMAVTGDAIGEIARIASGAVTAAVNAVVGGDTVINAGAIAAPDAAEWVEGGL